jgi:hypothetical protein
MSQHLPLRCALATVLATIFVSPAFAQSVTLDFTNTALPPIKLLDTSTVGIDANGNLTAECVLDGDTCEGISTGTGTAPAVQLTRNNGTDDIVAGFPIGLSWAVQNSAEICVASSSPAVSGWNGNVVGAAGGTQSITLSSVGSYSFGLKCFNDGGSGASLPLAATVVVGDGGDPPPVTSIPACTADFASDPKVQPAGFTGHLKTWSELFYGATFPEGKSHLSPVGSFTLNSMQPATRGPTMNGRYITTPFVPGVSSNYQISWLGVQAILAVNYTNPRAASSVFVSISPCAGDLRPRVPGTSNQLLSSVCRGQASNGSIKFGTSNGPGQCALTPGQTYFVNIALVDVSQEPLSTTTTTCAPGEGNRCEANFDGL